MSFCRNKIFSEHREEFIDNAQAQVMPLTEGDTLPSRVLENMLSVEHVALEEALNELDTELEHFVIRNLWHDFMSMSLSEWIDNNHSKTSWLENFFVLCTEALHQLWLERFNVMHEITMSKVRIEDHHVLLLKVRSLLAYLA